MTSSGVVQVILERDGHDQPWGFRLQGGQDVGLPLSIQRILVGTPAEGVLRKGDIVCKVSCTEAKGITHQQAADLFTKAGNQIQISIRRPGAVSTTTPGIPIEAPKQVPVSGGIGLPGMVSNSHSAAANQENMLLQNLPKTKQQNKPLTSQQPTTGSSSPLHLSIQNQPYRTSPLIQPSAKTAEMFGPGSSWHLKMQAEYITGAREAQPSPDAIHAKASEFIMNQKVTGTLQQIQSQPTGGSSAPSSPQIIPVKSDSKPATPVSGSPMQSIHGVKPVKQFYNNPINLYSTENVSEVAKLNQMGLSGGQFGSAQPSSPLSPTGLINPNKPKQVLLNPPKEYNPKDSATWLALQETDEKIDPEKIKNYSSLREHGAVFSEVYSVPKLPLNGSRTRSPLPCSNPSNRQTRSPVADFLPPHLGGGKAPRPAPVDDQEKSAVMLAALAEGRPLSSSSNHIDETIPIYETNALGEKRRITQSASFNKLMMNILGE